MKRSDLFSDDFQRTLNDANNTLEDLINIANAMLGGGMSINDVEDFIGEALEPTAEELGVSFEMRVFVFPTLVRKHSEDQ